MMKSINQTTSCFTVNVIGSKILNMPVLLSLLIGQYTLFLISNLTYGVALEVA